MISQGTELLQLELAVLLELPDRGAELEHLIVHAGAVVHAVLRPSDDLALVVDAGREAVVSAEGGERPHHSRFPVPDEP